MSSAGAFPAAANRVVGLAKAGVMQPPAAAPQPTAQVTKTPAMQAATTGAAQNPSNLQKQNAQPTAVTANAALPARASLGNRPIQPRSASAPQDTLGVTPQETMQGQIAGIMQSNNPLLQRARIQATDAAATKGLQNSSMAVQAGEEAALSVASDIARNDANTYAQRGAAAQNRDLTKDINEQTFGQQQILNEQGADNQIRVDDAKAINEYDLQELRGEQSVDLANIEAEYKQLIQSNAGASQVMQQHQTSIAQIMATKDISSAQARAAVGALNASLAASLRAIDAMSGLDLSEFDTNSLADLDRAGGRFTGNVNVRNPA